MIDVYLFLIVEIVWQNDKSETNAQTSFNLTV